MDFDEYPKEKHLLTYRIEHAPPSVVLPRPGLVLRLLITNLRNRSLAKKRIASLAPSLLGLHQSLLTGSKDFPLLVCHGSLHSLLLESPFERETLTENTTPSPLTQAPAGLMVPPASPGSPLRTFLMPPHPEKAPYTELKADQRNRTRVMSLNNDVFFRVSSPVYRTDRTELPNRWRISDYDTEGNMLMSVLCQFRQSANERAANSANRKKTEDESSSISQSKKRLRL